MKALYRYEASGLRFVAIFSSLLHKKYVASTNKSPGTGAYRLEILEYFARDSWTLHDFHVGLHESVHRGWIKWDYTSTMVWLELSGLEAGRDFHLDLPPPDQVVLPPNVQAESVYSLVDAWFVSKKAPHRFSDSATREINSRLNVLVNHCSPDKNTEADDACLDAELVDRFLTAVKFSVYSFPSIDDD